MKQLILLNGAVVGMAVCPEASVIAPLNGAVMVVPQEHQAQIGWVLNEAADDVIPPPVPPIVVKVGPNTFKLLFKKSELSACYRMANAEPAGELAAFLRMVDDPRTDEIVLSLPQIQERIRDVLTALASAGVVEQNKIEERFDQILTVQMM